MGEKRGFPISIRNMALMDIVHAKRLITFKCVFAGSIYLPKKPSFTEINMFKVIAYIFSGITEN